MESWIEKLSTQADGIFITSSASGLMKEISLSSLENKCTTLELLPFSFQEYLLIKRGRVPKPDLLTPARRDEVLCMFLQYFENGGFPAVIKSGNLDFCQGVL